jgi:DNA-binding CsgD family transcriptional regulator
VKRILFYSLTGGILLALLKILEYQYFVRAYPGEVYGGLVAVLFSALGLYFGMQWARPKGVDSREVGVPETREVGVPASREVGVPENGPVPFAVDTEKRKELGITPREHEILGLIAEGLSNREIGLRLFVSENTVKTHSSRLFDKLGVNRRVQAVQKGRELRLLP